MAGRFSKLLEFIGLVDDEPDDMDDGGQRPIQNQKYGNQNRRPSQPASRRADYYEERRQSTPPRPEYEARQRRSEAPRYATHTQGDYSQPSYDGRQSSGYQSSYAYEKERMGYDRPSSARPQPKPARRDPDFDEFDREDARSSARSAEPSALARVGTSPSTETVIFHLRQLEECRDVIIDLLNNRTVLLNLEETDERIVQRAIDTLCGAAFALEADLRKASDKTYLIAPHAMKIAAPREAERRYS